MNMQHPRLVPCLVISTVAPWCGIFAQTPAATPAPGFVSSEFINAAPAYASCHAPTLAENDKGEVVAAWFAGTAEGNPDVSIWTARLSEGKWQPEVKVAEGGDAANPSPTWNPVLFSPEKGKLDLFYKEGKSPATWLGLLKTSTDGGATWSEARKLPEGFVGPDRNKPVKLADGTILCPSARELEDGRWQAFFESTDGEGGNWKSVGPLNDGIAIKAIQPAILTMPNGDLLALGRTQEKCVFQTTSTDHGKTWSELTLTSLPNPNSGIDAVTLKDGRHLLVYNHAAGATPQSRKGRSPLNVAISSDGVNWESAFVLENEKGAFSYPAVIQTSDGLVHIAYSWNRKHIKHVVIDPGKLETKPIASAR